MGRNQMFSGNANISRTSLTLKWKGKHFLYPCLFNNSKFLSFVRNNYQLYTMENEEDMHIINFKGTKCGFKWYKDMGSPLSWFLPIDGGIVEHESAKQCPECGASGQPIDKEEYQKKIAPRDRLGKGNEELNFYSKKA